MCSIGSDVILSHNSLTLPIPIPPSIEIALSSPINRTVLRDSWQLVNPDDHGYTWSNENNFARKTLEPDRRIDYIFVGAPGKNGLGHPLESCLIGKIEKDGLYPSDHFGIMTRFEG